MPKGRRQHKGGTGAPFAVVSETLSSFTAVQPLCSGSGQVVKTQRSAPLTLQVTSRNGVASRDACAAWLQRLDARHRRQNVRPLCLIAFPSTMTHPTGRRSTTTRIHHSVLGLLARRNVRLS
jgi:hypothetical protein